MDRDIVESGFAEVMPPTKASFQIVRAQIDVAVATAQQIGRSVANSTKRLMEYIEAESIAEECMYRLERKDSRTGEVKIISGASIRFAELVMGSFGHLQVRSRIVEEGKEFVIIEGSCHDLYTNNFNASEIARRITTSRGARYGADMIMVTVMAASAIAKRNAILSTIPQPLWKPAYNRAMEIVMGATGKLIDKRRRAIGDFALVGVTPAMLLAKLQKEKVDDIDGNDLVRLFGILNGIREDASTVKAEFGGGEMTGEEGSASGEINPLAQAADDGRDEPETGGQGKPAADTGGSGGKPAASTRAPSKPRQSKAAAQEPAKPAAEPKAATPAPEPAKPAEEPPKAQAEPHGIRENPEGRKEPEPDRGADSGRDVLAEIKTAVAEAQTTEALDNTYEVFSSIIGALEVDERLFVKGLFKERDTEITAAAEAKSAEGVEQEAKPAADGAIAIPEEFNHLRPDDDRWGPKWEELARIWLACKSDDDINRNKLQDEIDKFPEGDQGKLLNLRYQIKRKLRTA